MTSSETGNRLTPDHVTSRPQDEASDASACPGRRGLLTNSPIDLDERRSGGSAGQRRNSARVFARGSAEVIAAGVAVAGGQGRGQLIKDGRGGDIYGKPDRSKGTEV